mmetsp:Transcript_58391/g.125473  ORF Transcript_58391/g.125473 Transcript_58391/m.125473 type:complete len:512 (+) Transcript_58391:242-1777(+)
MEVFVATDVQGQSAAMSSFEPPPGLGADGQSEKAQGSFLPRSLPHVGFMRHAPQALKGELDRLLRRRSVEELDLSCDKIVPSDTEPEPITEKGHPPVLPRESPYVGFQRHAPPSPMLCFEAIGALPEVLPVLSEQWSDFQLLSDVELSAQQTHGDTDALSHFMLEPKLESEVWTTPELPRVPELPRLLQLPQLLQPKPWSMPQHLGCLPEEVWGKVLSDVVEVSSIGCLARIARGFPEALRSNDVWSGRPVAIPPGAVQKLAPRLGSWLPVWRGASKLILPRSSQLIAEVTRRVPDLPIEVAWRFDPHLKGDGVEVIDHGRVVRRIADEELVVLGDAPLPSAPGRAPYFEVCLDERSDATGDDLNDFGLGVTACDPEEIRELGAVADEIPRSWVVDFTQSSVVLSINNHEAAKGRSISTKDLREGDFVGLRMTPDAVELYINGVLCESLVPAFEEQLPEGNQLFPVLDLYGCTVQISRTDAEAPTPCGPCGPRGRGIASGDTRARRASYEK